MGLRYLRMRPTVARIMDDRILPNVNKRTGWNDALHFTVRQSRRECFRFSTTGISAVRPVDPREFYIEKSNLARRWDCNLFEKIELKVSSRVSGIFNAERYKFGYKYLPTEELTQGIEFNYLQICWIRWQIQWIENIDGIIRYPIRVCTNSVVACEMRNISFTGFYSRVFSFRSTIRYHRWFEIDRSRSCYFYFFYFFFFFTMQERSTN